MTRKTYFKEIVQDAAQMNKALKTMKESLRDKEARNGNVEHIYKKSSRGKNKENRDVQYLEYVWLRIFQN